MYNSSPARKTATSQLQRDKRVKETVLTSRFTCLPRCCFNKYSIKVRIPGIFIDWCWGRKLVYIV